MPVRVIEGGWLLEMQGSAYALGINGTGKVVHRYWGSRLPWLEDYPPVPEGRSWSSFEPALHLLAQEYPAYGGLSYGDPCLALQFADGVRDLDLVFAAARSVDGDQPGLEITLGDRHYPLRVVLHYRLFEEQDLVERWVTIVNEGKTPVLLTRVGSAQWHAPPGRAYALSHLTGHWSHEFQLRRESLDTGLKILEVAA